jgi:hypothetical protein
MIVSTFWADEILLVPTWIITISILLIFIFPLESNYVSELIQLYEDWSSDAYKKYLRFKLDDKIAVAEKMRNHILNSL